MSEDGVLAEYLRRIYVRVLTIVLLYVNSKRHLGRNPRCLFVLSM